MRLANLTAGSAWAQLALRPLTASGGTADAGGDGQLLEDPEAIDAFFAGQAG